MNKLLSVISLIPEFRKGNHLVYPIDYLLLVAFCTMMCNQTSWHAMEDYAEIHQKDLRKLYFKISGKVLRRYTPSHDVFCAVFQTLSPVTFHNAFSPGSYRCTALSKNISASVPSVSSTPPPTRWMLRSYAVPWRPPTRSPSVRTAGSAVA